MIERVQKGQLGRESAEPRISSAGAERCVHQVRHGHGRQELFHLCARRGAATQRYVCARRGAATQRYVCARRCTAKQRHMTAALHCQAAPHDRGAAPPSSAT